MEPSHLCERCGYCTHIKAYLFSHLRRKVPCPAVFSSISPAELEAKLYTRERPSYDINEAGDKKYVCAHCNKSFKSASSKYNHKKNCAKQEPTPSVVFQMQQQIAMLTAQMASMKNSSIPINQTNNNNHTVNAPNANTAIGSVNIIMDFGKENLSSLTPEFIKDCLYRCQPPETLPDDRINGITKLLKELHSIPENKNVRVKNLRNSLMETRKENRWVVEDKGVVLNKMLERGFEIINTFKCDNSDIEDVDIKFMGIMDEINDYLRDLQEGQPSVCNPIKRDIWIMLINEKNDEVVLLNGGYPGSLGGSASCDRAPP